MKYEEVRMKIQETSSTWIPDAKKFIPNKFKHSIIILEKKKVSWYNTTPGAQEDGLKVFILTKQLCNIIVSSKAPETMTFKIDY